jgi:hypothetical protein
MAGKVNKSISKTSGTRKAVARGSEVSDGSNKKVEMVVVRRQWNHWMQGTVKLEDIDGFHWDDYSGGVCSRAPRPFIHGYVRCDAFIEGEVAHSCAHGNGSHNIKVCVVKKDNHPKLFRIIKDVADDVQSWSFA